MPGEKPGPLQVRAIPGEEDLPTPEQTRGLQATGGRTRGSNKDRLQLELARGAAAAGLPARTKRAPWERRGLSCSRERGPEGRRSASRRTRRAQAPARMRRLSAYTARNPGERDPR